MVNMGLSLLVVEGSLEAAARKLRLLGRQDLGSPLRLAH